jgi:hypothetical protein
MCHGATTVSAQVTLAHGGRVCELPDRVADRSVGRKADHEEEPTSAFQGPSGSLDRLTQPTGDA